MTKFIYKPKDEFLALDELQRRQTMLLREHLGYCKNQSPFYRKKLSKIDFADFELSDLKHLPITSKSDIAENNSAFFAVNGEDIADIVLTSGTTGKPCQVVYTKHDMQRLAYNEQTALSLSGLTSADRVLLTCTMDRCFVAGLAYWLGVEKIGATAIRNGLSSINSHIAVIEQLNPSAIIGVPSFLKKLGTVLVEQNILFDSVKRLICIGEPLRGENLQVLPILEKLSEIWNVPVFSTYASSEIVTSFAECQFRCGGHLNHNLAILEIVDENDRLLPCGETGDVIITPLAVQGMPLVRFRTGDVSFMMDQKCECGRSSYRLGPILGRKKQMLKIKGTTLFPQTIFSTLEAMDGVGEYFIEVNENGDLSDEVTVYVELTDRDISAKVISERLRTIARVSLNVIEVGCEAAMAKIYASGSRKPIRFIDLRKKASVRIRTFSC